MPFVLLFFHSCNVFVIQVLLVILRQHFEQISFIIYLLRTCQSMVRPADTIGYHRRRVVEVKRITNLGARSRRSRWSDTHSFPVSMVLHFNSSFIRSWFRACQTQLGACYHYLRFACQSVPEIPQSRYPNACTRTSELFDFRSRRSYSPFSVFPKCKQALFFAPVI